MKGAAPTVSGKKKQGGRKMNKKVWTSLLVIGLAVLAIGGGTLAWFTAQANIEPNLFTAGILEIDADEEWSYGSEGLTNWNPGDCTEKEITVEVTGTKRAFIRVLITETWSLPQEEGEPNVITYHKRDAANVNWSVDGKAWPGDPEKWQMITSGEGEEAVTYWYYKGMFDPDEDDGPKKVTVLSKVCLAGAETGNDYQGATYTLSMNFEAIQVTNEAVNNAWGVYWDDGVWKEVGEED